MLDLATALFTLFWREAELLLSRDPVHRVIQILKGSTLRTLILHVQPRTSSDHDSEEPADGEPVPPTCGACCRSCLSPRGLHESDPTEPRV
jgi:hypothetical protein